MNLKDFTLTFPDEQTWLSLADQLGWVTDGHLHAPDADIVNIGLIYPPAPDPLPDPYVPVPYAGWNVNLRMWEGVLPTLLSPYETTVNKQQYSFAGGWYA